MWGTSFPDGKLTVDFGNEFGAPFIGDRSNFCFLTKKSVPNNFGLLQQYRPVCELLRGCNNCSAI
jgi:hypothetical protein